MPLLEPAYAFTIPSLHDNIPLDCRIYHPPGNASTPVPRGAIMAHPYAPLGGSYDDHVVMLVAQELLDHGMVVGTFNFRGAAGSKGKTSWSGKAEREDYMSFAGIFVYYLHYLATLSPSGEFLVRASSNASSGKREPLRLVLGGYSYGSLILTRLPPTPVLLSPFISPQAGTSTAEIRLRARTLATETLRRWQDVAPPARGRALKESGAFAEHTKPKSHSHSIVYGGEETSAADRRASRESTRRSSDAARKTVELPKRVRDAVRRGSNGLTTRRQSTSSASESMKDANRLTEDDTMIEVDTNYLLVSPLLAPVSFFLCPMVSFSKDRQGTMIDLERSRALAIFGASDVFTSASNLRSWAKKMQASSQQQHEGGKGGFEWLEVKEAGHDWHEAGIAHILRNRIASWLASTPTTDIS